MGGGEAFFWGAVGAVVAEFFAVLPYRQMTEDDRQAAAPWLWSKFYWACGVGLLPVGGIVAYMIFADAQSIHPIAAFQAGLTAPLIIERILASARQLPSSGTVD